MGGPIRKAPIARLGNHLTLGSELVAVAAAIRAAELDAAGTDAIMVAHLQHVCLSHHVRQDMGSVVEPASVEAQMVATQDAASANVASMDDAMQDDRSADAQGFSQGPVGFFKKGILHTGMPTA